jgi:hypothetical protein
LGIGEIWNFTPAGFAADRIFLAFRPFCEEQATRAAAAST